ncbi:HipA family kinase [Neobacillus niacini]|uniref:HipA family kinase n=1 Tax=Neobacillus niacini TaxID=86668 RepID=UPI0021CB1303|nr:HipA family kinase [Neobacillus niacini]MCM3764386.1 hypothetical protein [Neobacillus niacini]
MIMPISYQRKLDGKSNAHLITFSDGKDYVVKCLQQGFEKSLPNEWVGYCLGRYLGLPIPFARIVEIPREFSSQIPEFTGLCESQFQFASQYVPDCLNGHEVSTVLKITNNRDLAGIIVFDYWLQNRDRTRKNVLFYKESVNSWKLWAIDHAEIFGSYDWLQADIEKLPARLLKSATHQQLARFIEDENQFYEQLEIIQTTPILLMEEIVELIPDDWNVTKDEKKAMVTALVTRRHKVLPKLIERFIKQRYRPLHMKGKEKD